MGGRIARTAWSRPLTFVVHYSSDSVQRMLEQNLPLPGQFHIAHWGYYLVLCVFFALLIRVVISFFTSSVHTIRVIGVWDCREAVATSWAVFKGFGARHHDLWITFFIGLIELVGYPVLIHFRQLAVIGGWLLLKTASAASWEKWKTHRTEYTRFLFGNLLTIFISFWLSCFVSRY